MTSAAMRPARGRAYAEGRGYGLVLFAGVLLLVSGFWNLIYGIAAIANSHVLVANQLARWFGVAVLGLNLIGQMFSIPAYPFWSLTIIAMDVVALYGLCSYGS